MTLNAALEGLHIDTDKLREYEANGLLGRLRFSEGQSEQFIRRICLINFLLKTGMDTDGLKKYFHLLDEMPDSRDEQLRILRRHRYKLLDVIHDKQQLLDELDDMIRETKNDIQR